MDAIVPRLLVLSTLLFTVSSMLSVGLAHTFRDVVAPLRNYAAVLRALVANFVALPLFAVLLGRALDLDSDIRLAIELLASAAGAAFLIKLTARAGSDLAKSAGLLLLLVPATAVYMPLVVPLMLEHPEVSGMRRADVSAAAIAKPLVLDMLLPLAAGLCAKSIGWRWSATVRSVLSKLSTFALVALIASGLLLHGGETLALFGTRALLAIALLVCGGVAIGYLFGLGDHDRSVVFGLGTGQRNIAAALVVATQTIGEQRTTLVVVTASLLSIALLYPIATMMRNRRWSRPPPGGAATAA